MASEPTRVTGFGLTIPPGTRLNGIFEIERQIGAGGMGMVYRAHNVETGDKVAIKIVRAEMADNEQVIALFRKEAAVLHRLLHDAIVRYYLFTSDPQIGRPYLATEFVDGTSLSDMGTIARDDVLALAERLASGLQAAHEFAIFHRDISPDNVILPERDVRKAKIIDFGIARAATLGGGTVIGDSIAGKFDYMSPEQLGLYGGQVDARSDIYSLGIVLAEAVLGRSLKMGGTQLEVVEKRRKVPDLSPIEPKLRGLIAAMMQPRPEDRMASMAAVAESARALRTGIGGKPAAKPVGKIAAGVVGLLAIGGATAWFLIPREPAATPPAPPPLVRQDADVTTSATTAGAASTSTADAASPAAGADAPSLSGTAGAPPPLRPTDNSSTASATPPTGAAPPPADTDAASPPPAAATDTAGASSPPPLAPPDQQAEAATPPETAAPPTPGPTADRQTAATEQPGAPPEVPPVDERQSATTEALDQSPPADDDQGAVTETPDVPAGGATASPPLAAQATAPDEAGTTPPASTPAPQSQTADAAPPPPDATAQPGRTPDAPAASDSAAPPGDTAAVPDKDPAPFDTASLPPEAQTEAPPPSASEDAPAADPATAPSADDTAPPPPGTTDGSVEDVNLRPQPGRPLEETPTDPVIAFLRSTELGPCSYVQLTSHGPQSANIVGYGDSVPPFQRLDEAFQATLGFAADINLRPVAEAQCPAIDLASALVPPGDDRLKLRMDADTIKPGGLLSGAISGIGKRQLHLYLVGGDGHLYGLADMLSRNGENATFRTVMAGTSAGAAEHLLVAIAAPRIPNLPARRTGAMANDLDSLRQILQDEPDAEVAIGYFKYGD